jgi:hypothetical protein
MPLIMFPALSKSILQHKSTIRISRFLPENGKSNKIDESSDRKGRAIA